MMKGQLTKFVISLAYLCLIRSAENPCRLEYSRGVIDLTSLANTDFTPFFKDIPSALPSGYSLLFVEHEKISNAFV